jgi:acyl-CoA hydrolase
VEKALAIASIAHPKFRDAYLKELYDDPMFTKPFGFTLGTTPRGFIPYTGKVKIG